MCENSGCDLTWVSQISSFDKNYILESLSDFREYGPEGLVTGDAEQHVLEDDSITCLSLDALVEEYAIEQIDFLNIDAEGSDFDIFRQFDFKRFTPTVICIENLGFNQAQREYFDTVMAEYQYKFISTFGIFSEIYARA